MKQKIYRKLALVFIMSLMSLTSTGALQPSHVFPGPYANLWQKVDSIYLYFEDNVLRPIDGIEISFYQDNQVLVTGWLHSWNFHASDGSDFPTEAAVVFDQTQRWALGSTVRMVIPAGTFISKNDASNKNEEYVYDFNVPDAIHQRPGTHAYFAPYSDEGMSSIKFYFKPEVVPTDNCRIEILRNGRSLRSLPATTDFGDFDLHPVYANFASDTFTFEKGVKYTFRLPAGAVHALSRDDMLNADHVSDYVHDAGPAPQPPLRYVREEFIPNYTTGILGLVYLYYDVPVKFSDKPSMQLWDDKHTTLIKEVTPWLDVDDKYWIVKADFGREPLDADKGYVLIFTSASVTNDSGKRLLINDDDELMRRAAGVDDIATQTIAVTERDGSILIKGLQPGQPVKICTVDGRVIDAFTATTDTYTLAVANGGVYLVLTGPYTAKVFVK